MRRGHLALTAAAAAAAFVAGSLTGPALPASDAAARAIGIRGDWSVVVRAEDGHQVHAVDFTNDIVQPGLFVGSMLSLSSDPSATVALEDGIPVTFQGADRYVESLVAGAGPLVTYAGELPDGTRATGTATISALEVAGTDFDQLVVRARATHEGPALVVDDLSLQVFHGYWDAGAPAFRQGPLRFSAHTLPADEQFTLRDGQLFDVIVTYTFSDVA